MTTSLAPSPMQAEPSMLAKVCFQLDVRVSTARRMLKRYNPKAPKAFLQYTTDEERRFATGFFALSVKAQKDLIESVMFVDRTIDREWP